MLEIELALDFFLVVGHKQASDFVIVLPTVGLHDLSACAEILRNDFVSDSLSLLSKWGGSRQRMVSSLRVRTWSKLWNSTFKPVPFW